MLIRLLNGVSRFCFSPDDGAGGGGAPAPVPQVGADGGGSPAPAAAVPATGGEPSPAPKPAEGGNPAPDTAVPPPKDGAPPAAAAVEPPKGQWAENWREAYAGEDQAKLNILKRFADPKAALDAMFAANEKIRSGEAKKPLAKDATPEQTAAWRKENGIPEAPADYLKALPETVKLNEADKGAVDNFLKAMHGRNVPPDIVAAALESYTQSQAEVTAALQDRDIAKRDSAEETLRAEWGPDFKPNVTAMKVFIENNFPADVQDFLINSRLGDPEGTPLLCHPGIIKAFAQIGRELNPAGTLNGGKGMDSLDTINDQIKAYEGRMATKEWFKDEKSQAHYRELITARERLSGKK